MGDSVKRSYCSVWLLPDNTDNDCEDMSGNFFLRSFVLDDVPWTGIKFNGRLLLRASCTVMVMMYGWPEEKLLTE